MLNGRSRLRVYLSSTFEDLKHFRSAVFDALEKAGLDVARMEGYAAADTRPLDLCLQDVAASNIYVGVFAWRYGYEPPPEHGNPYQKSITELEYEQAERSKLRKLLFFAHPNTRDGWDPRFKDTTTGAGERGAKLDRLRQRLGTEKTASFFRSPDELATLVLAAVLRSGASGQPYNIRAKPANVVPRPALTRSVIDSLIGTPQTPAAHTVLSGAGGFGKTTLALEACHRPEVVRAFPDGLVWITLGDKPNLPQVIHDLHVDVIGAAPTVQGVDAQLAAIATKFESRLSLLVIDDVWRPDDLLPLLRINGPRLLVTTRLGSLVEDVGQVAWNELRIDRMAQSEAVDLLARGLPRGDPSAESALQSLASRLGQWPLLLELANARLREEHKNRGDSIGAAAARVVRLFEARGVLSFDRRQVIDRNAAVANSVGVGLDALGERHPALPGKAIELAIFPENIAIPVSVLCELWDMDVIDVEEDVLRPLDGLSLVRWDRSADSLRLHMMVHAALGARLAASGSGATAVHARLLSAWKDPNQLPHAYAWRWFGWHCAHANQTDTLRRLLIDADWLRRKLLESGIEALVREFRFVPSDETLLVVQNALRAAAHVLVRRPGELGTQLCGRIVDIARPELSEFVRALQQKTVSPWLRPLTPTLGGPGLVAVLQAAPRPKAVGISSDARYLVSVDGEGAQTAWDVNAGTPLRHIAGSHGVVREIAVSADGNVTSTCAEHLLTWGVATDAEPNIAPRTDDMPDELRGLPLRESEHVTWWAWRGDGDRWIAVTERMRNPKWHGDQHYYCAFVGDARGAVRDAVRFDDHSLSAATATPDGRRLITSSWPTGTRVWDLETGALLGLIPGDQPTAVACSAEGNIVVTAAFSGIVSIWDLDAAIDLRRRPSSHSRAVVDAKISTDETRGYTVSVDGTAITWDLARGSALRVIAPEASSASDVDSSVMTAVIDVEKNLVRFLVRDADFRWARGEVNSYDLETGAHRTNDGLPTTRLLGEHQTEDLDAIFRRGNAFALPEGGEGHTVLAASPDGLFGATGGPGQTVWLWNLRRQTRVASIGLDSTPSCCALANGGRALLVGEQSGRVHALEVVGLDEAPSPSSRGDAAA